VQQRIDSSLFTWEAWRAGSLLEVLGVSLRLLPRERIRVKLRRYAIGWCPGGEVPCRPKADQFAVMFRVGDREFWTHLLPSEFSELLP
jgi:hypothetical protein